MPNPKYKMSRSRTRRRRSHMRLEIPNVTNCPQCKHPKLPHRVCTNCGTYDGRQVFKLDEESQR